eukprot:6172325-Pleurochrysis_carterae.AAC.4
MKSCTAFPNGGKAVRITAHCPTSLLLEHFSSGPPMAKKRSCLRARSRHLSLRCTLEAEAQAAASVP